jgi:hypothetical protein
MALITIIIWSSSIRKASYTNKIKSKRKEKEKETNMREVEGRIITYNCGEALMANQSANDEHG